MNKTFTITDSGFDNNATLESHKDVTLADVSLTESTIHDLLSDEVALGNDSPSDLLEKKQLPKAKLSNSQISVASASKLPIADMSGRSSKDEKQRQNEEIVILESSSLSSETGSWESVFPPKMPEKDLCEKFIDIERQNSIEPAYKSRVTEPVKNETFQCIAEKSSYKSTCCFIDAASLVDEEERQQQRTEPVPVNARNIIRPAIRPVPCEFKQILSPSEFSESNDNDDSLEQLDPDSIQKDISPTIFEMTLAPDDSIGDDNPLEEENPPKKQNSKLNSIQEAVTSNDKNICAKLPMTRTLVMTSTPNNSIISLKASDFKTYDSKENDNGAAFLKLGSTAVDKMVMQTDELTSSVPQTIRKDILFNDFMSPEAPNETVSASMPEKKKGNVPNVSGANITEKGKPQTLPTSYCSATWVVDMSEMPKPDTAATNKNNQKPGDKACDSLRASSKSGSNSEGCKSRSSVDSDSSEKSTHKFYIDLSTLPDVLAPEQNCASDANNEKKNIFSMFIDLGENSSIVKEMPARLSSSLNSKKSNKMETKQAAPKTIKASKKSSVVINGDETFEKLESLCNSSQMSISEILQNPIAKKIVKEPRDLEASTQDHHRTFPRDGIAATIREESDTDQYCDIFVRLSDLDRAPSQKNGTAANTEGYERMTRSIPDKNWGDTSHTSSRSIDIISSFHSENALSLNRLFPHLKNDISRSMPGSLSGRTKSPLRLGVSSSYGDRDELASDMSEMSSAQSSMCRSVVENSTTEDTSHTSSLLVNCQSRLGQDLLRMFMEEIAPDVIVEVSGRRIKAHKCILSSRCQYFAGILSGGWVESAGNVISLPPFSYSVVHFALCHIYSGISAIPDSISIVELATIADMLSLEGLKEAIMFTLKAKYCHHFHEPCQVCTAGVLECFPLSSVYGLDELYRRCLRWITRHFRKVWPTKAFATLPSELLDKCYQEHLLNLTVHNLIDTVQDCGLTVASLQRCRWAEVVARLCRRLASAAAQFAAARLAGVVRVAAAPRAPVPAPAARALDACLASAVDWASPDELCRALALLHALLEQAPDFHPEHLATLRRRCEGALLRAAPRSLHTAAFRELPPDLRRRLRRYVDAAPAPTTPPSRRAAPTISRVDMHPQDMERVRTSFVPYAQKPQARQPAQAPIASAPRHGTVPPRVRTTKAQEERAKYNMAKSSEPIIPPGKPSGKAVKVRAAYGNAKPRYLEPRQPSGSKEAVGAARKPLGRLVSSSESSRNSSPVLARSAAKCDPLPTAPLAASRPRTADPSTESLSDSLNKYATYTKARRNDTQIPPKQPSKSNVISTRTTKIPVYLKQQAKPRNRATAASVLTVAATVTVTASPTTSLVAASGERSQHLTRHRGSLMMATKSSSAKIVPKIKKQDRTTKQRVHSPVLADIPIMERSGTFLKDEPTFGDKTTNIDIGK